ncbi:DNA alkylation repair protein [Nakamurella endophytica]|uniref:DNA alkylation repair protein n=1 Tax=Nakamurella endophytica TaxID=1748367 RepID=A0A917T189_9ACTN|nr:DNA alkylation repair protein [Nakamurella endophytica]GGM05656.1 DNA alkylation repair protein [Nakamurella endophytica]
MTTVPPDSGPPRPAAPVVDAVAGGPRTDGDPLVDGIRAGLVALAEPALAPGMQSYMRSALPFLGVRVPEVRRTVREQARLHPPDDVAALGAAAARLWREASYREERYAATALTGLRAAAGRLELLDLYREMVVTGAWWDHVDEIAHRVGALLQADPGRMRPLLRAWAREPDRWLRRVAVLAQLDARGRTDVDLLTDVVLVNADHPDFFVRKAIGWALRQYARTDPAWVRGFLSRHGAALSPLSVREAAKHL